MRVAKFGGTSLGDATRVRRVAERIAARPEPIALVVSAMDKTTDRLNDALDAALAKDEARVARLVAAIGALALSTEPPLDVAARIEADLAALAELLLGVSLLGEVSPATRDLVLSHGERLSAQVVAAAVVAAGRPAMPVDARDWLVTDARFGEARVRDAESRARLAALRRGWGDAVPVVTGFLGSTEDGRTTTLGRGGSDYTGALLAAHLGADELEIWTDVAGVYSADPALVTDAFPLERMTYGEALELAAFGARVLHPRTLVPLMEAGIPMTVRSTLDPDGPVTRVDARGEDDQTRATSITSLTDLALLDLQFLRLHAAPGTGERVQRALDAVEARVWLATHSNQGQATSLVVPRAEAHAVRAALEEALERELSRGDLAPITVRTPVALLTLVAEAMGQTPDVAGRLLGTLGRVGINVLGIGQSATQRSISVVLGQADLPTAVRTVHAAFHFGAERVSLLLLGAGTVGGALLRAVGSQAPILGREHGLQLDLVGVATSDRVVFREHALAPGEAWQTHPAAPWPAAAHDVLDRMARLPTPILVDCTAAGDMAPLYAEALGRGLHVVSANKKPLTTTGTTRRHLLDTARRAHRAWRYETTVGAALPIVSTLHDLVRTGDVVRRVEGSFSGTLGFLCDRLDQGDPIDLAVREAMARGYTEPRPQEDLAGTDAARKALILARELGLDLELEDVHVEPLVDEALLAIEDVGDFLAALTDRREAFAARTAALRSEGRRLRYLAVIDPSATPTLRVGPVGVDARHAAWGLRGSQALVAFTTDRYADFPLVVQGAGAGGDVTASGVLADIIRVAEGVRG